jgi:hypothetical protein
MTTHRDILVGREAYASDDLVVGVITGVTDDAVYVIVGRPLSADLLVPTDELHEVGGRLEIRRTRSYLDDAPEVDHRHLTGSDRRRLEEFYRARAA